MSDASGGLTCDDRVVLAFLGGVLFTALIVPNLVLAAIRYIPPVRTATHRFIVETVDTQVASARAGLPPELRAATALAEIGVQQATRQTLAEVVHERLSVPAADAALAALGAVEPHASPRNAQYDATMGHVANVLERTVAQRAAGG